MPNKTFTQAFRHSVSLNNFSRFLYKTFTNGVQYSVSLNSVSRFLFKTFAQTFQYSVSLNFEPFSLEDVYQRRLPTPVSSSTPVSSVLND